MKILLFFSAFYSLEFILLLWKLVSSFLPSVLQAFDTAYSSALKGICGVSTFASSHIPARHRQLLLRHEATLVCPNYFKTLHF